MDLQSLRIGNLVYIPKTKQIAKITAISDNIGVQVNNNILAVLKYDEIKPIKLNKKILLKFGFNEIKDHFENENCWIYLLKKSFEFEYIFSKLENSECDGRVNMHKLYNYVHELQNLYYSILRYELFYSA